MLWGPTFGDQLCLPEQAKGCKCRPMSMDRAGEVTEIWGCEAQSPDIKNSHEKSDQTPRIEIRSYKGPGPGPWIKQR